MPTIYLTEQSKKDDLLNRLIDKNMGWTGLKYDKDLAKKLMVCPKTITNRHREPGSFTATELRTLFRVLKFSDAEILEAMKL